MLFSSTALVSILPMLSVARLCAHHAIKPQVLVLESPNQIPTYEAPQIKADAQNHVHVVTRTITRTTHATTTLTSTTLPPLLSPTSISLYQSSSLYSSPAYHEDLKIKRDQTPTSTTTHTPLLTGHGPVQTGATFNVQGQSMTLLNGTLVKVTSTGTALVAGKTASASASKATSSSGAGAVGVGVSSFGLWSAIMVLVGIV